MRHLGYLVLPTSGLGAGPARRRGAPSRPFFFVGTTSGDIHVGVGVFGRTLESFRRVQGPSASRICRRQWGGRWVSKNYPPRSISNLGARGDKVLVDQPCSRAKLRPTRPHNLGGATITSECRWGTLEVQ
jgi:hypothetical protein